MWLLPNLSGSFSFSLSLQHSQQHTSFSITFLFILTDFRSGREKQTCGTVIETDKTMKTKRERQAAPYAVMSGMFLSPPERGKVGAEEKEKEKEEWESFFFFFFFQKPFAKAWAWEESSCFA